MRATLAGDASSFPLPATIFTESAHIGRPSSTLSAEAWFDQCQAL